MVMTLLWLKMSTINIDDLVGWWIIVLEFQIKYSWVVMHKYSAVPLYRGQFSTKFSQKTPLISPVRVRYGVYFVGSTSELTSTSAIAVLYTNFMLYLTML